MKRLMGKEEFDTTILLMFAIATFVLVLVFSIVIHADVHEILNRLRAVGCGGY